MTSNYVGSFFWTSPELLDGKTFGRNTDIWYYFFTNTVEPLLAAPYLRRALLCPGHLFTLALTSLQWPPLHNGNDPQKCIPAAKMNFPQRPFESKQHTT